MNVSTIKSHVIQEINQYCSTYESASLFCLSWEKVEMNTHNNASRYSLTSNFPGSLTGSAIWPLTFLSKFSFLLFIFVLISVLLFFPLCLCQCLCLLSLFFCHCFSLCLFVKPLAWCAFIYLHHMCFDSIR